MIAFRLIESGNFSRAESIKSITTYFHFSTFIYAKTTHNVELFSRKMLPGLSYLVNMMAADNTVALDEWKWSTFDMLMDVLPKYVL